MGLDLKFVGRAQAHLLVTRASGEEQGDSAGRSLAKRRQESVTLSSLGFGIDFALAATPRALVLPESERFFTDFGGPNLFTSQLGEVTLFLKRKV